MKKLRFTYDTNCFDNPALQTHYKALEAMALELPSPQPVQDFTSKMFYLFEFTNYKLWFVSFFFSYQPQQTLVPDYERIERKAGDLLGELNNLIFPPDYNSNPPAKRPAKSASATENKKIRESELTEVCFVFIFFVEIYFFTEKTFFKSKCFLYRFYWNELKTYVA